MLATAPQDFEVWPENWSAFKLFCRLQTQWQIGMNGPTGLIYQSVYPLIDRMGLEPEDWDQMLDDIGVLEVAALDAMREKD